MVDKPGITRRTALCLIGGGTVIAASDGLQTIGFSSVSSVRGTRVQTADDPDALLGLLVSDTVKKNSRELLVEVTNNLEDDIDVTVSLDDGTQGTLYGPNGDSGNTIAFSLVAATADSTDSAAVDIEANVDGTVIPFTVAAVTPNSSASVEGTRETEAVSGKTEGSVVISKLKKFSANATDDNWTIQEIRVESDEFELDRVEYEVAEGDGTVVGTRTDDASGFTYERKGTGNTPGVVIEPDDDSGITAGTEYTLTVRAYDVENNFDRETRTDTA